MTSETWVKNLLSKFYMTSFLIRDKVTLDDNCSKSKASLLLPEFTCPDPDNRQCQSLFHRSMGLNMLMGLCVTEKQSQPEVATGPYWQQHQVYYFTLFSSKKSETCFSSQEQPMWRHEPANHSDIRWNQSLSGCLIYDIPSQVEYRSQSNVLRRSK